MRNITDDLLLYPELKIIFYFNCDLSVLPSRAWGLLETNIGSCKDIKHSLEIPELLLALPRLTIILNSWAQSYGVIGLQLK